MTAIRTLVACVLASALSTLAHAQSGAYPARGVKIIVPQPAGGGYDKIARVFGEYLQELWGQSVIVENRAGANGIIGTEAAAKSPPDGYTIMLGGIGPHGINPALYRSLPYDAIRDFAPIVMVASSPNLLAVQPEAGVQSVQDLVALMKSRGDKPLTYASSGNGSSTHLAAEMFASLTGVKLIHVPYKGSAPARTDLLAGHIQMMFESMIGVLPFVTSGKLRALAVSGAKRSPAAPDIPTMAEAGVPGYDASGWVGVLAPAGTARTSGRSRALARGTSRRRRRP